MSQVPDKKALLAELYRAMKDNPIAFSSINWEAFAKRASEVGLHYHPKLGLMDAETWEAIKDLLLDSTP